MGAIAAVPARFEPFALEAPTDGLFSAEQIQREIATPIDVREVKEIRDKLDALRSYVRSSGHNLFQLNDIAELKVRAEW